MKNEYLYLLTKIYNNCSACVVLVNGLPDYIEIFYVAEANILLRTALESFVFLKYLIKYPAKIEDYNDHGFIEKLKDIAKSINYGFYDGMSHEPLLDLAEEIITKRKTPLKREDLLVFEKIKRINYFPSFRECIKDLKDDLDKLSLTEVFLAVYSLGSQLIHSNPQSIVEFYYSDRAFANTTPFTQDRVLKDSLHHILLTSIEIDKLLKKPVQLGGSDSYKRLVRLLYPSEGLLL